MKKRPNPKIKHQVQIGDFWSKSEKSAKAVINNIFVSRHFSLKNWVGWSVVKIGGKNAFSLFFY